MNSVGRFPSTQTIPHGNNGKYDQSSVISSDTSVWSDAASQLSDNSSDTSNLSTIPSSPSIQEAKPVNSYEGSFTSVYWPNNTIFMPPDGHQMQLPKRENLSRKTVRPTKIRRQTVRKSKLMDSLVDTSVQITEAIWPSSIASGRSGAKIKVDLPLRKFIEEILYRSGTSYSTLQVALYYLVLIRPHVIGQEFLIEQLQCGRRMFLTALILASKYLQDLNYSARAWSKISGLDVKEINRNEMAFLTAVNWRLHITKTVFQRWVDIVLNYTPMLTSCAVTTDITYYEVSSDLKSIVLGLNSQLDNVNDLVKKPENHVYGSPSQPCHVAMATDPSSASINFRKTSPTAICYTPKILEPSLPPKLPAGRAAPVLGLLPYSQIKYQRLYLNHLAVSGKPNCPNKPLSGNPRNSESVDTMPARLDEKTRAPPIASFLSRQLHHQHVTASPTYPKISSEFPRLGFSPTSSSSLYSSIPTPGYMPLSPRSSIHKLNRHYQTYSLEQTRSLNITGQESYNKGSLNSAAQLQHPLLKKSIMAFCPNMNTGRGESVPQKHKEHMRYHKGLQINSNLIGSYYQVSRDVEPSIIACNKLNYYRNSLKLPGLSQLLRKRTLSDSHLPPFTQPLEQNNQSLYTVEPSQPRKRIRSDIGDLRNSMDSNRTRITNR